jgi:tellurium resistance protein TerD
MAFNLEKGGRFNLSKDSPGMTKVKIGLGWDANAFDTGGEFDLDVSLFGLGANGKLVDEKHFIYYNQLATPNKSIVHTGDNRKGDVTGDDETVLIDLALLNPNVTEISFIVTIHEAGARKQNFGQVSKSFIKLYDATADVVKAQYNLEDDFSAETAVQFGSLFLKDGQWMFKAVGAGFKKGLADFVAIYSE